MRRRVCLENADANWYYIDISWRAACYESHRQIGFGPP